MKFEFDSNEGYVKIMANIEVVPMEDIPIVHRIIEIRGNSGNVKLINAFNLSIRPDVNGYTIFFNYTRSMSLDSITIPMIESEINNVAKSIHQQVLDVHHFQQMYKLAYGEEKQCQ